MDFTQLTLMENVIIFLAAAAIVALAGVAMTGLADRIADRTGLGEALIGGILLGASTSLSGAVTSISAAAGGHPSLALGNAVGGIAAQTAFLALADIAYRRANLEHAAASATNLAQASLLMVMLSLPLVAAMVPTVELFGVHIVSVALVAAYGLGLRMAATMRKQPMWRPARTAETREDLPEAEPPRQLSNAALGFRFLVLAIAVAGAGWVIAGTGVSIAQESGVSQTAVGALMTATATSLPELVTTLAAVRRGALQLAVGGIIGGNTFDVLFLVLSDTAYRPGSVYHAADPDYQFWICLSLLMTGILLLGLIRREKHGFANIGFESTLILAVYGLGIFASLSV